MTRARDKSVSRVPPSFNAVKVFCSNVRATRETLGETITAWIAANPEIQIVEFVQTQSSDYSYHCLTITAFFREPGTPSRSRRG